MDWRKGVSLQWRTGVNLRWRKGVNFSGFSNTVRCTLTKEYIFPDGEGNRPKGIQRLKVVNTYIFSDIKQGEIYKGIRFSSNIKRTSQSSGPYTRDNKSEEKYINNIGFLYGSGSISASDEINKKIEIIFDLLMVRCKK